MAQDSLSATEKILHFPTHFLSAVDKKSAWLESRITKQTEKYLQRLQRQEKKLKRKLSKKDSLAAQQLFAGQEQQYRSLVNKLKNITGTVNARLPEGGEYLPNLDTLTTSLNFLLQKENSLLTDHQQVKQAQEVLQHLQGLQGKMQQVEQIKQYLQQRKAQLKEQLSRFGMTKQLAKYNQEAWYYAARIKEYKHLLEDPEKLQQKAIGVLRKLPVFQKFVQQHSQLAGLFASPGSFPPAGGGSVPVVNGLASRAAVQQAMQAAMPSAGTTAGPNVTQLVQQISGHAGSELNNMVNKLNERGGMGDKDLPDFKPNTQRTKSFGKRLEPGVTFQFGRSTNFLPATSDIGLQLGYRLNDKSSIGIGATYKLGMGSGWNHIRFTNESIGLRSYLKATLKGRFFAQGGAEWNYMMRFAGMEELKNFSAWHTGALLGLGKSYKVSKKISGNVVLLYDFLHKQHTPASQPLMFRVGYSF